MSSLGVARRGGGGSEEVGGLVMEGKGRGGGRSNFSYKPGLGKEATPSPYVTCTPSPGLFARRYLPSRWQGRATVIPAAL